MKPKPTINRGAEPTEDQEMVEDLVHAADCAFPGISTPPNEIVSEEVREAVIQLCKLAALHVGEEVEMNNDSPEYGILLTEGNATIIDHFGVTIPYQLVLRTHVPLHDVENILRYEGVQGYSTQHAFDGYRLFDGTCPWPVDALDGQRFRHAFRGLLRLIEQEAQDLNEGGDCRWGGEDEEGNELEDEQLDEEWSPGGMLLRIREMRRESKKLAIVADVLES